MEFREYYLGVPARIRYNSQTEKYIGDIDAPEALRFFANSYEELQEILQKTVEDFLTGNGGSPDGKLAACAHLERLSIVSKS